MPVFKSPVVVMAGSAAVPAWTVVTPVTPSELERVAAPVTAKVLERVAAPEAAKVVRDSEFDNILLRGIIFSQRNCDYGLFITSISVQGRGGTQN